MVLVIDDDPTLAPLVEGLLSAGGEGHLDVDSAATLAEGIEILQRNGEPPCVVLLDLRLPDSDGLATLAACREVSGNRSPIVVLTADGDRSLAVAALREGADDFLLKTELTARALSRALRYSIERTQYRAALAATEARAGAVFRSIDSMIAIVGADGTLLEVNDAWSRFAEATGCPVMQATANADFLGHCRALHHPFADLILGALGRLQAHPSESFEEIASGMPPCGSQVHLRVRACTVELAVGRGVAIVLDDFTERFAHQEELRVYAERLTLAIEAGHVGTFTYDLSSGHVEWSPWHYRIVGIEPAAFGQRLSDFLAYVHPDDRDRVVAEMEKARTAREPIKSAYRIVRSDGAIRFIEGEARFTFDAAGNAVRLSGAIVDTTDQRVAIARQGLSHRLEALGELATGIAHDLRNTLSLAHTALNRLADIEHHSPVVSDAVADLRLVSDQAGQLIGSLLDFAKPRRSGPTPVIDLNHTVLHFVSFLRRLLPASLRVSVECGRETAPVVAEAVHVQQVIMNLVLNARDATDGAGEIQVRVVPGSRAHLLEVTDNGPGIAEADRAHLFEPFYRGRTDGSGAGLGLAIVKAILDANAASISFDAAARSGSIFRILWPAATQAVESDGSARPGSGIEAKPSALVVLVQPPGYARRVLADGLAELGYRVDERDDLTAARKAVVEERNRPSALIVDDCHPQGAPHASGAVGTVGTSEWLRELREAGCTAPIVLLTDAPSSADEDEFLVLFKPYSVGQVQAAVRAVLDEGTFELSDEGDQRT
jgi:PAS domain S-box-containing protein